MPARQYKYEAYNRAGEVRTGKLTARDESQVEQHLAEQDLMPISISTVNRRSFQPSLGFLGASAYEQLIMFTNSLATMQRSGVPLLRALSIIRIGKENGHFNRVIDSLRLGVESGRPLSQSMEEHPEVFSRVYVASVAAGEESGRLEHTLDELSAMLEKEMELSRQIKQATRYPLIVLTVIGLAFIVMMTFVVPRFVEFYSAFDAQLPGPTRALIAFSELITSYWAYGLGLLIAAALVFRRWLATDSGRARFDSFMLHIPIIGNLIVKGNVARFALMFRILFQAGIPLVKTLEILASTVKNTQIGEEIQRLSELFRKGRDINSVKGLFRWFPELSLHMMDIGMESGSLDRMMQQVGAHYSQETMYRSRQLTSILEPLLTLVLGAFVLVMALAIFLPMWSLIKVFQG
ncbi:MAG: type II secretion system F family protein [candidate division Zixibacteria bacterium]|jgi:MSHA biogenesis protein MshG|nr:type II secretion system F family protein [candidate division Zixibacteria bacterium]